MVNHIYDPDSDATLCGDWTGVRAREISSSRTDYAPWTSYELSFVSCPECHDLGQAWTGRAAPAESEVRGGQQSESEDLLERFLAELRKATGDGQRKRTAGVKPPWYLDQSHEGAIFSHLTKWKRGEAMDPDSGAHPLVHMAWRALAIACQESGNVPNG